MTQTVLVKIDELPCKRNIMPDGWRVTWNGNETKEFAEGGINAAQTFALEKLEGAPIGILKWNAKSKVGRVLVEVLTGEKPK